MMGVAKGCFKNSNRFIVVQPTYATVHVHTCTHTNSPRCRLLTKFFAKSKVRCSIINLWLQNKETPTKFILQIYRIAGFYREELIIA